MNRTSTLRTLAAATIIVAWSAVSAAAQGGPGYGMGYGPGYGPGYGMGYGRGYGPGYGMGYGPGYGMDPGAMGFGRGYGMGPYGMQRSMPIDADGNGIISADEAAAHVEAAFDSMDADDDGALTLEEFASTRMHPWMAYGPHAQARQQAMEARFGEIDTEKKGAISKEAFLNYARDRFAASDTDKDGKVTPWEFRARMRMF